MQQRPVYTYSAPGTKNLFSTERVNINLVQEYTKKKCSYTYQFLYPSSTVQLTNLFYAFGVAVDNRFLLSELKLRFHLSFVH